MSQELTPARVAAPLRCCAAHGRNFWLGHDSPSFGGRFFCPAYLRDLFAGYDPQPSRPLVIGERKGDHRVRLLDGGWPTPDTNYLVIARDGDQLTLRQLGMPDWPVTAAPVGATWPARYVHPSTQACAR